MRRSVLFLAWVLMLTMALPLGAAADDPNGCPGGPDQVRFELRDAEADDLYPDGARVDRNGDLWVCVAVITCGDNCESDPKRVIVDNNYRGPITG